MFRILRRRTSKSQKVMKTNGESNACAMTDIVVGIDLGTTYCCAAYYFKGKVKVLENAEGDRITPSCIFFAEKNKVIVGSCARIMADGKPEYGVYDIKRLIGKTFDDPHLQNNIQYFPFNVEKVLNNEPAILINHKTETFIKSPQELCTTILKKIKTDIDNKLGENIDKAVITVPAYFNMNQRKSTLEAARNAGFTVLKLLNEPTAAALTYYFENDCQEENYSLVYDLGGGTFDVSILRNCGSNIDIVGVDGDTHLGGRDFDNLIIDHVCDVLVKKYKCNPKSDRRTMRRLHNLCEEAKKVLSTSDETSIVLHGFTKDPNQIEVTLTRQQFEKMADSLFRTTINIVNNTLESLNLSKDDIKEVILSGGSTRIPKIRQILSSYFDEKKLNNFGHPDECVAEGAALQAALLSTHQKQEIKDIQIKDVLPLSIGTDDTVYLMTFAIKRNTPIPVSETHTFRNALNRQKSMPFNIYEGERKDVRKNRLLDSVTITDLTPMPPGQCKVDFTMSVDHNGILSVKAKEKLRDNIKDLKILYSRGYRNDREVKNAVKDAEDFKEEDERFVKFAALKKCFLNYCERAKYNFENKGMTITHKEAYAFCKHMKSKGNLLELSDEAELNEMISEVKSKCQDIVKKYGFQFMPTL